MKTISNRYHHMTSMISRFLLCLILGAVFITQTAASPLPDDEISGVDSALAVDPTGRHEGYSAILYDNTNGLPTSEANDIIETPEGFIWIGSYSGLIRYDGNTFERMDSTGGITSAKCLYLDSRERLWIGTNDSGVAVMEKGNIKLLGEADGMCASSVRSILEDQKGNIYVATTGGLNVFDAELNLHVFQDTRVNEAFIQELRIDNDGVIYGLTNDSDIFTIKDNAVTKYISHESSHLSGISCLFPDPVKPGYFYIEAGNSTLYHGLFGDPFDKMELINISPIETVSRFEYIAGKIWLCTRNGIGVIDNNSFSFLSNLPMNNSVGHVMKDYEGNLWFTSSRQGVMKIVPNQFSDITKRYDLPETVVNSTCMYDDQLFIATDNGLIVINETERVNSIPLKKAAEISGSDLGSDDLIELLNGVRIRSVISDSRGQLWISTWKKYGLLRYSQGEITAFTDKDGLFTNNVRAVYECSDGSMLVANTGGVCVIKDDRITASYNEKDGIENTEILTVCEGIDGDIICGTDGGGIFVIGKDSTKKISRPQGLTSEAVMRIKWDPVNEVFWVVTGNSIAYMTKDYTYTTIDKFPYSNNFDLYINSENEVWVISSDGIYIAPADVLIANEEITPTRYGMSDGLPIIATANSYSEHSADGSLYIAGTTGVAKVNIDARFENVSDLKISVPYIETDGVMVYPDENGNFTIPSSVKKLTIYSYVYNYSLINPQVSYRLDGFDTKDVTVSRSDLDPVVYTNLSGGVYRFIIRLNDPINHNDKTVSIRITKEKAFYEHILFYIIAVFISVAWVIVLFSWYVNKKMDVLEKKNREEAEKSRISSELDMASRLQNSMLPTDFPAYPDRNEFDIFASMDPAREVGGDFYDFFLIDEDHLCLVMADVSGKGIPAALFMMISKVILQSCAMLSRSPSQILTKTNEALCSGNKLEMFVTTWIGIIEISSGHMIAANAGHEYPAIRRAGGSFEVFKDSHSFILGGMEGARYKEYELQLEPGDTLFLYTDGVPEATNESDELFGLERMINALNKNPGAPARQILADVRQDVDDFVKEAEQFDDMTMMCFEYKGSL